MIERGWGRIINISTSLDTMLKLWPYGSTKAALEAYTANLARAVEGTGVTANALLPGGLTKSEPIRDEQGKVVREVLSPAIMEKPAGMAGVRSIERHQRPPPDRHQMGNPAKPDGEAGPAACTPIGWAV